MGKNCCIIPRHIRILRCYGTSARQDNRIESLFVRQRALDSGFED